MGILDAPVIPKDKAGRRLDSFKVADGMEQARRRPASMNLIPAGLASTLPTITFGKFTGAAAISVASGGSGYVVGEKVTLAGGTFSTAAVGLVTAVSSGAITGIAVDRGGVYTATPANPVSVASTTGAGTGATFTLTWNSTTASSITTPTNFGPTNAAIMFTGAGPANILSTGYYGDSVSNGTATAWEWTSDAAAIDIKLLGFNTQAILFVNGERIDTAGVATDASGAPYLYSLNFGGVAAIRNYRLMAVNSAFGGVSVPSTARVWKPIAPRRPLAYGLGDSYMFGTGATTVADAAFDHMCNLIGFEPLPDGVGGSGWTSTGSLLPQTRVQAKLDAFTRTPDVLILDLGYNDAGGNLTTVATNFDATVAYLKGKFPLTPIFAFGPATPVGSTANLTLIKNTISGRCTALGVTFVDVEGWVDSANKSVYTGVDNVHPTPAGHAYIGARKAQALAKYF